MSRVLQPIVASGYFQVPLDPRDREKSAFITGNGLFEFNVMPFGLCNGPATFQRLMTSILAGLQWRTCVVYLDDIVIVGETVTEHLQRLREVLTRLREAGLKIKPTKCQLMRPCVSFLGYTVSENGVATDPGKTKAIADWPTPTSVTDLKAFLGLASYYRRFVANFADIAPPLHDLTKKATSFQWTSECQESFSALKQKLLEPPVLTFPDFSKEFILDTDASDVGLGGVLSQIQDGVERVVAYGSRCLSKSERNYCVTRKELLAVVHWTNHFRHYLLGAPFQLRTDHNALIWLHSFKQPEGQVARWLEKLSEFQYRIEHRPGKLHGNADGLSRRPCKQCGWEPQPQSHPEEDHCSTLTADRPWTNGQLHQAQMDDPTLRAVHDWLEKGARPPKEDMQGCSRKMRSYWSQFDRLLCKDGIVCRKWIDEVTGQVAYTQKCLPPKYIPLALAELHDSPMAGHLGVNKTTKAIRSRFYWQGLSEDVETYIRQCPQCNQAKNPPKPRKAPLHSIPVGYPLEKVCLDLVGPLPKSNNGFEYIVVVTDLFTKWPEAYPLRNTDAPSVARRIMDDFICRFGCPEGLHSDQGPNLEGSVFHGLCDLINTAKSRTTPYHPQSDPAERMIQSLTSILRTLVSRNQKDWDELLPKALMSYRTREHKSTGYTPYRLMFGREARLPVDAMLADPPEGTQDYPTYVAKLKQQMVETEAVVRDNLKAAQKKQKDHYDVHSHGEPFKEGDRVWYYQKAVPRGKTKKLWRPWQGPWRIVKVLSDVTYRIQTEAPGGGRRRNRKVVHFNMLKPCTVPAERLIPQQQPGRNRPRRIRHVCPPAPAQAQNAVPLFPARCSDDSEDEEYVGRPETQGDDVVPVQHDQDRCAIGPKASQGSQTTPVAAKL